MLKLLLKFGNQDAGIKSKSQNTAVNETIRQILKECFWDFEFTAEDILRIVKSGSFKEKMFLFEKIIPNSTNMLKALKIFAKDDLYKLLEKYKIPSFNHKLLQKRVSIAMFVFLTGTLMFPICPGGNPM